VRSGRVEFYKDEDTFLQLGEQLPVYKETFLETEYKAEPDAKNKYKLAYVTRNSLYRVHSTHSNNRWLNELQGDKPKVFLNEDDARERNIENGDYVEIFNSRGKTKGYAVIDKGALKGKIVFEQGWWSRYLNNESYNSLIIPWIKPTHEIYFVPGTWSPNTCWNECLVDVRRIES
jgi:anaerobic selenocysteine-containing dehydrogenase